MPREGLLYYTLCQVMLAVLIVLGTAAPSCSGGGGSGDGTLASSSSSPPPPPPPPPPTPPPSTPVTVLALNLTESDVNTVMLQAVNQASALGAPATIAVVDRVGNVLAVTQMTGAPPMATVTSNTGVGATTVPPPPQNGLEGVPVPSTLAAISKALTGAYLSSNGNAFSTRTANQIIQQHFNPGVAGTPSGPLFGVQFSQLPCSDFNTVAAATPGATNAGPHRSPLGFAADSGGLPIYKNGMLQGGIGVMSTATYSLNLN